jgi:hypothetical protein
MQKLKNVCKAHQNNGTNYVLDILPKSDAYFTPHFLRNENNYVTIARRTQIFTKSFIPSSVELWKYFEDHIRHAGSLYILFLNLDSKKCLKPQSVPKYFLFRDQSLPDYHARDRNKYVNRNNKDLYKKQSFTR